MSICVEALTQQRGNREAPAANREEEAPATEKLPQPTGRRKLRQPTAKSGRRASEERTDCQLGRAGMKGQRGWTASVDEQPNGNRADLGTERAPADPLFNM